MIANDPPTRRSVLEEQLRREESMEANLREGDAVGDLKWEEDSGSIRIAFQNTNGLGFDPGGRKYNQIFNFINKFAVDILGMAETNSYWPKIPIGQRLFDKTKEWFEARHLSVGFNKTESRLSRFQPGGVATIT